MLMSFSHEISLVHEVDCISIIHICPKQITNISFICDANNLEVKQTRIVTIGTSRVGWYRVTHNSLYDVEGASFDTFFINFLNEAN